MTYTYVAFAVIVPGLLAGLTAWIVRRLVPMTALRRHHDVGQSVFLQLGVIFAVLLAFVFSEVWSEYNTAAAAINAECASLHGAVLLSETLPAPVRTAIDQAAADYIRAVIDTEWSTMQQRQPSLAAQQRFYALIDTVGAANLSTDRQEVIRGQILAALATAHQNRETRLFQMMQGVPHLVWGLLITFAVILTAFLLCFGIDYIWSQVTFTAVFAGMTAFVLVVVQLLDFPFEGVLRLSPSDFNSTLARIVLQASADAAKP